ncbi:MAG: protein kinase [Acidobacteriota bacterium]|nr:protein kinase [Acidobacteriota bacterium]MDQ5871097.1 protein kinase [Acidobacteriota bacterium]
MTLASGTRLGPYELLAPIGAGGMGEVYRAKDTRLERTVAVKVLSAHLSASPESRQRFEREARTISQLSHPHICALYDVGREGETEYLVMEYLEGETLADRLARGPLSTEQVLRYGVEIADALDKAHRQGIVHRDLKPGNVMITKSGVKLLDFGLAKAMAPPGGSASSLTALPTRANLTQEGTILGTFQYMAPEQLEGKEADSRTDIFAFGALLYEMATGKKAFWGESHASLISSIMAAEPPPVSTVAPMAPPALDRVVRRCLVKDPEGRWQSARDVALELDEIARSPVSPTAEVLAARSRRRDFAGWIIAAGLLLALVAALFGPWRRASSTTTVPVRFTVPPPRDTTFQGMLALSPDGRRLAFVATTADGRDLLWTRALDSLEARALEGTDGANYPFWSPDGRFLAFFAGGKLKKIDTAGGSPQTLCNATAPRGGSWGSTGTLVFAANAGGQLERVAEAGGESTALPHLTSKGGDLFRWPTFLPDGHHFLYYTLASDTGRAGLFVASVDSSETARVAASDSGAAYVSTGFLLYRVGDRLVSQGFDPRGLRVTGVPVPFVEDVWWDGISTLATAFSASSGGIVAYQTGGLSSTRLLWLDRTGKELGTVGPPGAYLEPALSPDERWLAVGRTEPGSRGPAIWTFDLERGGSSRFFSSGSYVAAATPLWSPDGRRIVCAAFPSGEVYVRDAQGSEKEKLLYKAPAFTPLEDWSRDGRLLFYDTIDWPAFRFDVGVRDLEKGTDRLVLSGAFNEFGARLSPDGRWLAYQADESGVWEVFVRSFPEAGFRRQVSTGGGSQPRWRGDGRELFYVSDDRKIISVDVRTGTELETGTPHPLFQTRILPLVEARNHYDVSADGQRFLVNSRRLEDATLPIHVVVGWAPKKRK